MKYKIKIISIVYILLFGTTACVAHTQADEKNIKHKWQLSQVIYDDGSVNQLEPGNFVHIEKDVILEIINQRGERRYPYTRKNRILYVTSGEHLVEWKIIHMDTNDLQLKTPIGVYILKR